MITCIWILGFVQMDIASLIICMNWNTHGDTVASANRKNLTNVRLSWIIFYLILPITIESLKDKMSHIYGIIISRIFY